MTARNELERFGARYGDEVANVVWTAALGMLEQAAAAAREGIWGRWRTYPRGELKRLRRDVARGLALARLAVALQDEADASDRDLAEDLRRAAALTASRSGRERTLDAEYVRIAKAAARRAGAEFGRLTEAELEHWAGPRSEYYAAAFRRSDERATRNLARSLSP